MHGGGWTDAQRKAYVIADNKLALGADWDEEILKTEFATLQELEFDVGLTGFTLPEIGVLMAMGAGSGLHGSRRGSGAAGEPRIASWRRLAAGVPSG